ncbi:lasso RiPP family leader peptide-containing protein [Nocardia sp. NPDC051570]
MYSKPTLLKLGSFETLTLGGFGRHRERRGRRRRHRVL